jgi:hypothetical protein
LTINNAGFIGNMRLKSTHLLTSVGIVALVFWSHCLPTTFIELDTDWKPGSDASIQDTKENSDTTKTDTPSIDAIPTCLPLDSSKVSWLTPLYQRGNAMLQVQLDSQLAYKKVKVHVNSNWSTIPPTPSTNQNGALAVLLNRNSNQASDPIKVVVDESTCFTIPANTSLKGNNPSKLALPQTDTCTAGQTITRTYTITGNGNAPYTTASCSPNVMEVLSNTLTDKKLTITMKCLQSGIALLLVGSPDDGAQAMKLTVE